MKGVGKVLVVGGGIGGMAAALALARKNVAVDLVDIDPEWKVYGAGITITGPTLRAFRDLGLIDGIRRHGFFARGQRVYLFDGTLLGQQVLPPIEPDLPASGGIMRPKLHELMSEAVVGQDVRVRLGVTIETIADEGDTVDVGFTDGSRGRYDLVIGADGIYSKMRAMLFPGAPPPVYTGQMSWRVVAPRPADLDQAEFYFGHRHVGGIVPCSADEVYAFILNPDPDATKIPAAEQPAYLRALIEDFGGGMATVRETIGPGSSIVQRPFEYALLPKPWHVGRVVLIGDAAHATTPHLASGAGIAVEDALVLAEELEKAAGDIAAALHAFTERRYERCRFVVESSVAIGNRQMEGASAEEIGKRMGQAMGFLAGPI